MKKYQILLVACLLSIQAHSQIKEAVGVSPVYNFEIDKKRNYENLYLDESIGKYYTLVIGVNNYFDRNIQKLDNPIPDAEGLIKTLTENYNFDPENVTFLKDPVRVELMQTFESLIAKLKPVDNLLIYYAGHGYWDKETKQGYWLLSDAIEKDRSTWFLNESLLRFIEKVEARHILLVSDACFSGGIFKSRSLEATEFQAMNKLYKFPSRKAMTSGALTTVPDKSIFTETLVKRLTQNKSLYISAERIFHSLKNDVVLNGKFDQIPQFGEISSERNHGGDFVFIRRSTGTQ
jgi:hypothetical protein